MSFRLHPIKLVKYVFKNELMLSLSEVKCLKVHCRRTLHFGKPTCSVFKKPLLGVRLMFAFVLRLTW